MASGTPDNLTDVVREVLTAVLEGDWLRFGSRTDFDYYYVLRTEAQGKDLEGGVHFDTFFLPKPDEDAFVSWYIRAALSDAPESYVTKLRVKLAKEMNAPERFDELLAAARSSASDDEFQAVLDRLMGGLFREEGPERFSAVLQHLRVERVRRGAVQLSEAERDERRPAIEAMFLREFIDRYRKLVERALKYDWLSDSDPQLREACRCYLYGFNQAATLLAASAIERRLKYLAGVDWFRTYEELVAKVFGTAGVIPDAVRQRVLNELFKTRNRVAHQGSVPDTEATKLCLDTARETLEFLANREALDA